MVVGALGVEWTMWTGRADVLFTSYVPLRAHPAFYLGVILFAVGALLVVCQFFATLVVARREKTYQGSVPLVTFGALTAAIIAVITLGHGAAIYIPTFFWSLGMMHVDPQVYRMVWWGLGHSSQQINVAAMVSVWYLLAALSVGGVVLNEKISRSAFVLYVLFISMASAHHLLVDPGLGPAWKIVNTSYFMYMAVLASMIHGFTVPAGIEVGQRLRGFTKGMFEWLRKAPWGDPGFSAMILSVVVFGFVGGITGVTFGTEQINIIAHNTLRIPGHFHATVVSGTALAFMGVTYYVIPLIFRKQVAFWSLARIQPYLFAGGMLIFSVTMTFAGTFGVPRRHWDITFSQAPFDYQFHPAVDLVMGVMAVGGLLGAVGGAIYILVTVWSVFFGKPIPEGVLGHAHARVAVGAD
jgi:cytochrome c oxidase subunit 1